MKSPQLVSDVEKRKVITARERRVLGYFSPAGIRGGERLVICKVAISGRSASGGREGDQEEKGDEDRMMLEIEQCLLL